MHTVTKIIGVLVVAINTAPIANAQLPDPGVEIVLGRTALLITDPRNDFLSPRLKSLFNNHLCNTI